jgi:hypothetical protein
VESIFSAIKRKLGGPLYSRTQQARLNELLAKILAYNVGIVIYQARLHGLSPSSRRRPEIPSQPQELEPEVAT